MKIEAGYIYILINPALKKDMLKIGCTTRSPEERAKELSSSTGIPAEFSVVYEEWVPDSLFAERITHERLAKFRVRGEREFFKVSVKEAIPIVTKVAEEIRERYNAIQEGLEPEKISFWDFPKEEQLKAVSQLSIEELEAVYRNFDFMGKANLLFLIPKDKFDILLSRLSDGDQKEIFSYFTLSEKIYYFSRMSKNQYNLFVNILGFSGFDSFMSNLTEENFLIFYNSLDVDKRYRYFKRLDTHGKYSALIKIPEKERIKILSGLPTPERRLIIEYQQSEKGVESKKKFLIGGAFSYIKQKNLLF